MLISEISPSSRGKISLENTNKKNDQLKTNQPLPLTANKEQKPTEKEFILLQKIKHLEKENTHLKALVQQFQERQSLVRDQKNETSTQIIQPLHKK